MAYSLVDAVAATNLITNGVLTTGAINTTGADFIAIVLYDSNGGATQPTDNKGNSYHKIVDITGGPQAPCSTAIWVCASPTVGSGHTFSINPTGQWFEGDGICVSAWSGSNASPDDQVSAGNSANNVISIQPGSLTPSQDNELIISILQSGDADPPDASIDGGYTIIDQRVDPFGNRGLAVAYLIQTSATATNPTWTTIYQKDEASISASFKAGGGAATPRLNRLPSLGVS